MAESMNVYILFCEQDQPDAVTVLGVYTTFDDAEHAAYLDHNAQFGWSHSYRSLRWSPEVHSRSVLETDDRQWVSQSTGDPNGWYYTIIRCPLGRMPVAERHYRPPTDTPAPAATDAD